MVAHIALWAQGFRRREEFSTKAQIIYHRPAKNISGGKSDDSGNGKRALPLVFVHGIGIGFPHYLGLISKFPSEVDVYLVEWPHVAHQITASVPTAEETVSSICGVLDADKHPQACFFAHSLGTASVSWMLHHPEGCRKVASTILVDPVTFLLCDPTVATTFVYNDPKNEIDFMMHYFVSRELFIANALSRHFNWSHNIMFVEELSAVDAKDEHAYVAEGRWSHRVNSKGTESNSGGYSARAGRGLNSQYQGSSASQSAAHHHNTASRRKTSSMSSGRTTNELVDDDSINGVVDDEATYEVQHLRCNHTIVLSKKDSIVPVAQVARYLSAKRAQGHTCFETVFFDGIHGEIFLYPKWCQYLADTTRERAGLQ
jgi:pimeloyl-ACP methyl ester carboxylesterase